MRFSPFAILVTASLSLVARAEAPPTQQFIYQCGAAAAQAPVAAGGTPSPAPPATATETAAASSTETVHGSGLELQLGAFVGTLTQPRRKGNGIATGAQVDARALYYFGLEAEGIVGGSGETLAHEGMAHVKLLLPLRSPILDVTPKAGLGVFTRGGGGGGAEGFSALLGLEVEIAHFLVVGADFVTALTQSARTTYSTQSTIAEGSVTPGSGGREPASVPPSYGYDDIVGSSYSGSRKLERASAMLAFRLSQKVRIGARITTSTLGAGETDGRYVLLQYRF